MKQRPMVLALVGTAAVLAAVGIAVGGGLSAEDEPALKVAELLDSIVQPRFQKDSGVFGVSRVRTVDGHEEVARLRTKDPAEARILEQANAPNRDYLIAFLHMAHVPGRFKNPAGGRPQTANVAPHVMPLAVRDARLSIAGSDVQADAGSLEKAVLPALPRLRAGEKVEARLEDRLVVMRPVRALQASCLECHTEAKRGDTLGVMVYAVTRAAGAAPR